MPEILFQAKLFSNLYFSLNDNFIETLNALSQVESQFQALNPLSFFSVFRGIGNCLAEFFLRSPKIFSSQKC